MILFPKNPNDIIIFRLHSKYVVCYRAQHMWIIILTLLLFILYKNDYAKRCNDKLFAWITWSMVCAHVIIDCLIHLSSLNKLMISIVLVVQALLKHRSYFWIQHRLCSRNQFAKNKQLSFKSMEHIRINKAREIIDIF